MEQALKLPRLRLQDELLQSAPALGKKVGRLSSGRRNDVASQSLPLAGVASRPRQVAEEEEDDWSDPSLPLKEMSAAKQERANLMASLAALRREASTGNQSLMQAADIASLEKTLAQTRRKYHECRAACEQRQAVLDQLTEERSAMQMESGMPTSSSSASSAAAAEEELPAVAAVGPEAHLTKLRGAEATAESRNAKMEFRALELGCMQTRLAEQSAKDRRALERTRALVGAAAEDEGKLTNHNKAVCGAREVAEHDLAGMKARMLKERAGWEKKLKERRKEVKDMMERNKRETEKYERQRRREREKREQELNKKYTTEAKTVVTELSTSVTKHFTNSMEDKYQRLQMCAGGRGTPADIINHLQVIHEKRQSAHETIRSTETLLDLAKRRKEDFAMEREYLTHTGVANNLRAFDEHDCKIATRSAASTSTKKGFSSLHRICVAIDGGGHHLAQVLSAATAIDITAAAAAGAGGSSSSPPGSPGADEADPFARLPAVLETCDAQLTRLALAIESADAADAPLTPASAPTVADAAETDAAADDADETDAGAHTAHALTRDDAVIARDVSRLAGTVAPDPDDDEDEDEAEEEHARDAFSSDAGGPAGGAAEQQQLLQRPPRSPPPPTRKAMKQGAFSRVGMATGMSARDARMNLGGGAQALQLPALV